MTVTEVRLFIDGRVVEGRERQDVTEPATGNVALRVHLPNADQIEAAVASAKRCFAEYSVWPAYQRAEVLHKVARSVEQKAEHIAMMMVGATGKTIRDARGEVARSVATLINTAEEATRIEGFEVPMETSGLGAGRMAFARRYPVGVMAAITPFNAPLNTVCHKVAPALAAGNTVVLKPDLNASPVALALAQIFIECGLPAGAFNVVHGDAREGEALVTHPLVELIGFTGSTGVGERIRSISGLKGVHLELGGIAPAIVHEDADLDKAAAALASAAFGMSGQSCISIQRIYAHATVFDDLVTRMTAKVKAMRVGSPSNPETDLGPMISEDAAIRIENWIKEAVESGATLHCGGEREKAYLSPALLTGADMSMKVMSCEAFGPVATITPYDNIDWAFEQANNTDFGLQAGVFTNSMDLLMKAVKTLRFGGVIHNGPSRWRLDNMPYGGVKRSGIGREGAKYAIEELTELRMIVLDAG